MAKVEESILKKEEAERIIEQRMLYAAGLSLIPIPVLDIASVFSTQILMAQQIAKLYDVPFSKHRTISVIGILIGDLGAFGLAKVIPGLGSIAGGTAMSISAAAATYALGKIFAKHFSRGGNLFDFNPEKSKDEFKELYREGETKSNSTKNETKKKVVSKERFNWVWIVPFILLIGIFVILLYLRSQASPTFVINDAYLFEQEEKATNKNLQLQNALDSLEEARIASFSPGSTEGVIRQHLTDQGSVYPKQYALDGIRFTGSSAAIENSGAEAQLQNISLLMKKYPEMTIHIFGHVTNRGPKFYLHKMGRERARILKDMLVDTGISGYRITANYIEKSQGTYLEYWGADILIDVSSANKEGFIQKSGNKIGVFKD